MDYTVTEVCPSCEYEITLVWCCENWGYKAYCPVCGERLMICSECMDGGGQCDYNNETDSCKYNSRGEPTLKEE